MIFALLQLEFLTLLHSFQLLFQFDQIMVYKNHYFHLNGQLLPKVLATLLQNNTYKNVPDRFESLCAPIVDHAHRQIKNLLSDNYILHLLHKVLWIREYRGDYYIINDLAHRIQKSYR